MRHPITSTGAAERNEGDPPQKDNQWGPSRCGSCLPVPALAAPMTKKWAVASLGALTARAEAAAMVFLEATAPNIKCDSKGQFTNLGDESDLTLRS